MRTPDFLDPVTLKEIFLETADRLDPVPSHLPAQPLHTQVDDPAVAVPAVLPHVAQQGVPLQYDAGVGGELQQGLQVARLRTFYLGLPGNDHHPIPYVEAHLFALKPGYEPMGAVLI